VRLGAFTVVDSYPEFKSGARDRLAEVGRLAEAAEAGGLSSLWVAEHHFHPGGACPSPPVLLAALGARTRRLRLGSLVAVLPFHSPIELAEQYALVDRLLGGRLNFGVGSGYLSQEFEGFGVDPEGKRALFDQGLETILRAWRGEAVRGPAPSARPVHLNVLPFQRPAPPVWVAAQRREALPHLARAGRSIALIPYATVDSLEELSAEVADYRAALSPRSPGGVAAAVHVYAGDATDQARAALQRYLDTRLASQSTHYAEKVRRDPRHGSVGALEEAGMVALGSVPEVRSKLRRFEEAGVDDLLGIFDFGGLASDLVVDSVTALGRAWDR
jgi:alkanesulfonate monooxygenase SsuD/methylene tetrahydromethanopterin reductase-like flavin-dependent oxidoreductase (luciferase family)